MSISDDMDTMALQPVMAVFASTSFALLVIIDVFTVYKEVRYFFIRNKQKKMATVGI